MQLQKIIRLALIVLAVGSLTIASAQPGPRGKRGPRGPQMDVEKLKTELQLTDQQVQQIEELTTEQRTQMKQLRDTEFESPEARREAMKALQGDYRDGLADILTAEQQTKMKALQEGQRAQKQERAAQFKEKRKATRDDIKSYREENVIPVLQAQRAKLEPKISAEDKALISELRAKHAQRPKRLENPSIEEQKAAKAQFEANKEERQAHKEQIKALLKTYETDIDALYAEIEPQVEEWKSEMKEIAAENRPADAKKRQHKKDLGEGKKQGQGGRKARMGDRGDKRGHVLLSKMSFLLLDPNAPATPTPTMQQAVTEIKVFPNPTFNQNTLSYSVKEAGHLRIELHNESGRLIEVLFEGNKDAGEYQLDVDMSKLRNGVYYYTVMDQKGKQSHKVIVNK